MKKLSVILALLMLFTILGQESVLCKQSSTTYKKYNVYNSKGQKDGYYKVYSSGQQVTKVEKYNRQSKKQERIEYSK